MPSYVPYPNDDTWRMHAVIVLLISLESDTCERVMPPFMLRSMRALTGSPFAFSLSPCKSLHTLLSLVLQNTAA